jgi:hypothetical protein
MIKLFSYANFLKPEQEITEWSCPHCYKPIKWEQGKQLSPLNCPGCLEQILDVSKIITNSEWRITYHRVGEIVTL